MKIQQYHTTDGHKIRAQTVQYRLEVKGPSTSTAIEKYEKLVKHSRTGAMWYSSSQSHAVVPSIRQ